MTLELQSDQLLDEQIIYVQYGLSRTPVREILRRMTSDGYIKIQPNQAARISPMGLEIMQSFLSVAPLIFTAIGSLAVKGYKKSQLEELKKAHERFRAASDVEVPQVMVLASHRFFEVLGEMAASPYLEASFSRLLLDKARLDMLVLRPKGQLLKAKVVQCLQWQKQIMDAIEEQSEERVSLQMHRLFDLTCIN